LLSSVLYPVFYHVAFPGAGATSEVGPIPGIVFSGRTLCAFADRIAVDAVQPGDAPRKNASRRASSRTAEARHVGARTLRQHAWPVWMSASASCTRPVPRQLLQQGLSAAVKATTAWCGEMQLLVPVDPVSLAEACQLRVVHASVRRGSPDTSFIAVIVGALNRIHLTAVEAFPSSAPHACCCRLG